MTQSTDAILVFGFSIGEEGENPDFLEGFDDFEDFVVGPYESGKYAERKAMLDLCPADLTVHCHHEYPMHILGVRGTAVRAWRGDPKEIVPADLTVSPERIAAFKAWCEEKNIEYQEPKWLLCSMWS